MPPELQAILNAAEMRGERIVNHVRFGFTVLSLAMLAGVWDINTPAANTIFAIQLGAWLTYSVALYVWFHLRRDRYVRLLKYLSITVDLGLLVLSAAAMHRNQSGIIEYFQGFLPLTYVFWNLLSGLRYSLSACLYAGALSAVFNGLVLFDAVSSRLIPVSDVSVYGQVAINVGDQILQIVFISIPAVVAGIIARLARTLVLRAEEESLKRARLEREREQLQKYLSKELVEVVIAQPNAMELGGARRHATVMFTDVRSFTPLSESREPEDVVALLNAYFSEMVPIVFRYGGLLDKFLGDGLMAVFGVPFDQQHETKRAVLVALEMLRALERFNRRIEARGYPKLEIGVGIATGTVVAGNIGSPQRMEYTCIGDTVNFASRLQSLSRDLGSEIVLSEAACEALGGRIPTRHLPPIRVKGKRDEVSVHVIDPRRVPESVIEELRADVLRPAATVAGAAPALPPA
jgi:class 3 adenylate cyclase